MNNNKEVVNLIMETVSMVLGVPLLMVVMMI